MRRGSLLLIGIASAVATIITLNVTLGGSWNYYGYGHRWHYCDNRYRQGADRSSQSDQYNRDNRGADSATGKY